MPIGRTNRPSRAEYVRQRMAACSSLFALVFLVVPAAAFASDTMERVSRDREINIGYRTSSVPLSFVEKGDARPLGYNIDVCTAIGENIKKDLKRQELRVKFVPVNGASRVPMLLNHRIDLE